MTLPTINTPRRRALHGLREPRPGYFTWDNPVTGESLAIGRVDRAVAEAQAYAAILHVRSQGEATLLERLTGTTHTIGELLKKMPAAKKPNTARVYKWLDKKISLALGARLCRSLSVSDCAELIDGAAENGNARSANALRSRLIGVCNRGMALGWLTTNPAEAVQKAAVQVQRGRLTLDMFKAIYAVAPSVAPWLPPAMRLALVSGADRSTLCALEPEVNFLLEGYLLYRRPKTECWVKVPMGLKMNAIGWSLLDAIADWSDISSPYFLHHTEGWGGAKIAGPVALDTLSDAFRRARRLAGIPDVGDDGKLAPTFHEIRSLCKREYLKQGGVDTKALLGHAGESSAEIYSNPRGVEPVEVRVSASS